MAIKISDKTNNVLIQESYIYLLQATNSTISSIDKLDLTTLI